MEHGQKVESVRPGQKRTAVVAWRKRERERERSCGSQRVALYPQVVKQLVKRAAEMRSVSSGSEPICAANLRRTR